MGDDKPAALTHDELDRLLQTLPGWKVDENKQLAKQYVFKDFVEAMAFVNRLVPVFESKDHHPDIHISYKRVTFELSRHDIGRKITSLCGDVAKAIEHAYLTKS